MDKTLQFKFSVDEANLILDALGGMPFKEVYQLIEKIQKQAASQLGDNEVQPEINHQTKVSKTDHK